MDAPVIVAIISAAASLFASALTFFLTKKKEREADWRKQKLDHYKEFMAALNDVVGPSTTECYVRFTRAANNIFLVGSSAVLIALRQFLDEVAESNKDRSEERHDHLLTKLMYAIRDDLDMKPNKPINNYTFRLRWSGRPRE